MPGNILIIEDVKETADLITLYLSREGFETRAAKSAEEAFAIVESWKPELIILDLKLPGKNGFTFLEKHTESSDTPVLIISAGESDEDRINALFSSLSGLIEKNQKNILEFGPYTLDYDACILKKNGERVPLSTNEYNCLVWLTEHSGKPMSVEAIYAGVWKNKYGDITTVAVYIQRLRKKIEEDPSNPVYIVTVHGMGYQFNIDKKSIDKGVNQKI